MKNSIKKNSERPGVPPPLKHYQEFDAVLTDYHISPSAQTTLKNMELVLLTAATSTGRSVVVRNLLLSGRYHYIVSDTTRPPQVRDGQLEQNGVQYFFRKEEDLLADLKAGNFLEAEIIHGQQVSGISIRELENAEKSGKIAFTETDIAGVQNIKKAKPDTLAIFLLPPSFEEWLKRIEGRGGLSPEELARRMNSAARFWEEAPRSGYFQFVVTEEPEKTISIVESLVAGQANPQQERGQQLAAELLAQLHSYQNR